MARVILFKKDGCVFCDKALGFLYTKKDQIEMYIVKINSKDEWKQMELYIGAEVKTVPQIVVGGKYIPGGYTGLSKYHDLDRIIHETKNTSVPLPQGAIKYSWFTTDEDI